MQRLGLHQALRLLELVPLALVELSLQARLRLEQLALVEQRLVQRLELHQALRQLEPVQLALADLLQAQQRLE